MRDIHYLTRKAFLESLTGQLEIDGDPVGVYDEEDGSSGNMYVLLSSQNANEDSSFSHFAFNAFMLLRIVHKQDYSVTKKIVDDLAGQILAIIVPTPSTNGLVAQSGVQFLHVKVESDRHQPFQLNDAETIMQRLLRFALIIHEQ